MYVAKNKVQLIGRISQTPQITVTEENFKSVLLLVNTEEAIRNKKGEKVKQTLTHRVICYNKHADIAEKFLHENSEVALEGKLVNNTYTDPLGKKKYFTEVEATDLLILSKS
jgi:single-strand DNA-binding protein